MLHDSTLEQPTHLPFSAIHVPSRFNCVLSMWDSLGEQDAIMHDHPLCSVCRNASAFLTQHALTASAMRFCLYRPRLWRWTPKLHEVQCFVQEGTEIKLWFWRKWIVKTTFWSVFPNMSDRTRCVPCGYINKCVFFNVKYSIIFANIAHFKH